MPATAVGLAYQHLGSHSGLGFLAKLEAVLSIAWKPLMRSGFIDRLLHLRTQIVHGDMGKLSNAIDDIDVLWRPLTSMLEGLLNVMQRRSLLAG